MFFYIRLKKESRAVGCICFILAFCSNAILPSQALPISHDEVKASRGGEDGSVEKGRNLDGYIIPPFAQGISVSGVYVASEGHVVLGYSFFAKGVTHYDFYDTHSKKRLAIEDEVQLASSSALLSQAVERLKLKSVEPRGNLIVDRAAWTKMRFDGSRCIWPYSSAIHVAGPGYERYWMLFSVETVKKKEVVNRNCEGIDGAVTLTLGFRSVSPTFYELGDDGPYAAVDGKPFLIHFHKDGSTRFFQGRKDIALVDGKRIEPIVAAAGNPRKPQQYYVKRIENVVRAAISQQENSR